jgi:hypothetical protein
VVVAAGMEPTPLLGLQEMVAVLAVAVAHTLVAALQHRDKDLLAAVAVKVVRTNLVVAVVPVLWVSLELLVGLLVVMVALVQVRTRHF